MYIIGKGKKAYYLIFLFADALCIIASCIMAYYIRHQTFDLASLYWQILTVLIISHLCIFYFIDMDDICSRGYLKELNAVFKHNMLLLTMFSVYMFASRQTGYSRLAFLNFILINIVFMYVSRVTLKHFVRKYYRKIKEEKSILLVTTSEYVNELITRIKVEDTINYRIKGIVILDKDLKDIYFQDIPVVANGEEMYDYVRKAVIDEVLINLPHEEQKMHDIAEVFIDMGIAVHINLECIPIDIPSKKVHALGDMTVVTGSITMRTPNQALIKRSMDIVGGIVGIIFTGMLMIFIAPAIYLESPGSVFFTQIRVGRNGRYFKIYKFRSMHMDAEEKKKELMERNIMKGNMFKIEDDPRITKVGKFIRRTSIDEFPQFWNVLKGDMSLVGTRPPTVDEYECYEASHKKRLAIQPGLTGIWQVNGRNNVVDFEKIVQMDAEYIVNWSLGLDCRLILKTIKVLLGDRNAY